MRNRSVMIRAWKIPETMMSENLITGVVTLIVIGLYGCSLEPVRIANPASVNCLDLGGRLEMRTAESGGEYALCHLPNGTVCEEWVLFRKECP
jgi:putative hemolysin